MTNERFSLNKDLILDVCEPHMVEEKVKTKTSKRPITMYRFGSFEGFDSQEYIFGCDKTTYNRCFKRATEIPIRVALVHNYINRKSYNEMISLDQFSQNEIDVIRDVITHFLEARRVAGKYALTHC